MRRDNGGAQSTKPPTLVGGSSKSLDMASDGVGEVPAWEACGKVIADERAAYWEFVVRPRTDASEAVA